VGDTANLQFDRAESGEEGSAPASCTRCRRPLQGSYYQVNGAVVCEACRAALEEEWSRGSSAGRFGRAVVFGIGAAAAGAGLYYAILALTGYEFGLVAIVVGFMVGFAVKKGSNGRGGWRYQALAMFLTYTSIVSSYVPLILREVGAQQAGVVAENLPTMIFLLYALPFLSGFENILGLIIIAIGLYEAWKLNKPESLSVTGPYQVGSSGAAPSPV
jgi:hypothetical protein